MQIQQATMECRNCAYLYRTLPISVNVCGFVRVCDYLWDQSNSGEATPVLQSSREAE